MSQKQALSPNKAKAARLRYRAQELVRLCPENLSGRAYCKLLQRVAALEIAARECEKNTN